MERRYNPAGQVRLQRAEGQPSKINGYASVFYNGQDDTEYELYSEPGYRVVERVMSGAFTRAINEDDPVALYNHDVNQVLGRKSARTLRLSQDGRGLAYEIDPPDTQCARDLMTSIDRGDITGSSFAFRVRGSVIRRLEGADGSMLVIRELTDCQLFDVSPVTRPAYTGTTTGVRADGSLDQAKAEVKAWLANQGPPLSARLAGIRARAVSLGA